MTLQREILAPRYLERFQCIGSACEENCCTGWRVLVDKDHFKRLREAMGESRDGRERFHASLKVLPSEERAPLHHAAIERRDDGTCTFFGADRLCELQQRFGEEMLSNTCAN